MNNQVSGAMSRSRRITFACSSCLLLILTFSSAAFAQAGTWARQRSGTMAWLHSLYFLDQNHGWVVGSKGTLLYTRDGGNTWTGHKSSTEDVVRHIFFIDEQNGWMV